MKRIIVFFCCIACVTLSLGTSVASAQHLTFKGVSIDGHIDDFVEKMKNEGFKFCSAATDSNLVLMEGVFAGNNCDLAIFFTRRSKTVYRVNVFWENKYDDWDSFLYDYKDMQRSYNDKYGKPSSDFHFFSSPYKEGDGYEMTGVRMKKCNYSTFYKLNEGTIMLAISHLCRLQVGYEDAINLQIHKAESQQNVLGDI